MADILIKGMEIPTRYIDAMKIPYHFDLNAELWANKDEIDKVPTISPDDVRGVGKWIHFTRKYISGVDDEGVPMIRCSVCDYTQFESSRSSTNYCPNCGAKMEVE